ncbi:MAG: membrane dipeptidase [Pseudomonadota bacterium]
MRRHELYEFQRDALVLDIHLHDRGLFPPLVRRLHELVLRGTAPPFRSLGACRVGGVDGGIVCPVGDFPVNWKNPARANLGPVARDLRAIRAAVGESGGAVVASAAEVLAAKRAGRPAFVLGLEGGNPLGQNLDNLQALRAEGVLALTLVHFSDNALGTVETTALEYWGRGERKKKTRGLTSLGEAAIRKMNDLGMIVDLAHADRETLGDVVRLTRRPVIVSHTGARALGDFKRYIGDDEIRAVASTGGVVGLWPFYFRGRGMPDIQSFQAHARHVFELTGEDHLAVGTDAHGVPGLMKGYWGLTDAPVLTAALFEAGFTEPRVRKILGLNFLRVMAENQPA